MDGCTSRVLNRVFWTVMALYIATATGCRWQPVSKGNKAPQGEAASGSGFLIRSAAFSDGQTIPKEYTADGKNISPPVTWTDPPTGTKSFAIICEDPDAPGGTFTHWLIYNVPAELRSLEPGVPRDKKLTNGALQGKNDFGDIGYGGPDPPPGKPHRYIFHLYALDSVLDVQPEIERKDLLNAIQGHILAEAQLIGMYGRNK